MKKTILAILVAITLSGCATDDYKLYTEAQVKVAEANALAAKYKADALVNLGASGDSTTRVAAVMALSNSQSANTNMPIQQPKSATETMLQWAGILAPTLTQLYSVSANKQISMTQIQASVETQKNAQESYVEFGKLINTPTIVTQPAPIIVEPKVVNPVIVNTTRQN